MTLFRDKLAYSENQASKNLKLYRVKQKEVGIFTFPDQDSKNIALKTAAQKRKILSHSTRKLMKINKKYCPTQVELAQAKAAGLEDALETVRRENYIQRNKYHTQRILRGRIV